MVSATSIQAIPNEWIDFRGANVGYVKQGFRDQVLEAIKKESAASFGRLAERLENGEIKASLTAEQKRYLEDHFDLKNMSWEDYQSLVDKLCEFGVLGQEDKKFLHCGVKGADMVPVDLSAMCVGRIETTSVRNPSSFASCRGDILGWMEYLSGFQSWNPDSQSWQKTTEARLFERVRDLLEQISK